jgi:hypothetical protein
MVDFLDQAAQAHGVPKDTIAEVARGIRLITVQSGMKVQSPTGKYDMSERRITVSVAVPTELSPADLQMWERGAQALADAHVAEVVQPLLDAVAEQAAGYETVIVSRFVKDSTSQDDTCLKTKVLLASGTEGQYWGPTIYDRWFDKLAEVFGKEDGVEAFAVLPQNKPIRPAEPFVLVIDRENDPETGRTVKRHIVDVRTLTDKERQSRAIINWMTEGAAAEESDK